ncbi:class I SAM-dependent methyltransferase [Mycobacterium decipiens]|uniref:S-adenosyl-L-methionine-dependent methyltransferase n=1 Tax=Mycobacterium decipiens TaxID=1430326 RepID=A0A1X2LS09_9MYCO|nr:SAM-dependent methyltransferase [Mycobacterium decipiens]
MRVEDDGWDVTTSVGSTGLLVAAARALETRKPDRLAVDPYAEVFCRAAGGEWADVLQGRLPDHYLMTRDFGEHFVNFQGARTRYFDEYFSRAAGAGVLQVVILAAGLDARAFRLRWPHGTTIFELDRPQVLDFKRAVLADHRIQPRAERREVAVDLRSDWRTALCDKGFDANQPSAWIAEGLLVYLSADVQQQLFVGIDALASPGSHVAVEEATPLDPEEFAAKLNEERAANAQGDPRMFFQMVYNQRWARAVEWFGERGWSATATPLANYLRRVGRPVPATESDAAPMIAAMTFVGAVRAG